MLYDELDALEGALCPEVAAVIVEPIQVGGGVRVSTAGYLKAVEQLCHANGGPLVVDQVQTGFCRTGPMFASSAAGLGPDLLTIAKGIAGGHSVESVSRS